MGANSDYWPTILDVAKRMDPNGSIASVAEIIMNYNEILTDIPWIEGNLPTGHQTTVRTSNPTPTYRLLNSGVVPSKTSTGQIVDTCAIIEARSHIDKDIAMLNGNTAAFRLSEDKGIIEGMNDALATALFYGDVSVNPEQFNGLAARYYGITAAACPTTYANVIDGGGTGSDNTSIWLVCWSPDKVFGIYPKGSQGGLQQRDLGEQSIIDNVTTGAYFQALVSWYQWKCGITIRDWRYIARICSLDISDLETATNTSDTSANILKFMSQAIDKVPNMGGTRPVFYMNNRVMSMLRVKLLNTGTTTTNPHLTLEQVTGQGIPRAGGTLLFQGIPCRRCDALTITESDITA